MISEKLNALIKNHFCTVIMGTEKNAGKTTVLASIMARPLGNYAITGIGRDGESTDVVFGTEKPKILVPKDTLVATASSLLKECTCTFRILATTSISTPLGEVIIFRAEDEGFVQIAGPSIVSQLVTVREKLRALGADKVIIDGALGRKTFSASTLADAAILVSGASTTPDMKAAVEDAAFIADMFSYPISPKAVPEYGLEIDYGDQTKHFSDLNKDILKGAREIRLSGGLTDAMLALLLTKRQKPEILVSDPGKILSSRAATQNYLAAGGKIKLVNRPRLIAVCTNAHSIKGYSYDAYSYARAIKQRTGLLVIDVKNEIVL